VADDRTQDLKQAGGRSRHIHLGLQNATREDALAALNRLDGISAAAEPSSNGQETLNLVLTCQGEDDPRPAVYAAIKDTDWILVEFVQRGKNLETIFRELTKEN
jgi:ABC-2 type transport system ATP-binding protein